MWQPLRTGLLVMSMASSALALADSTTDDSPASAASPKQLPARLTPPIADEAGRQRAPGFNPAKGSWKFADGKHHPPSRPRKKSVKPGVARIIGGTPVSVGDRTYQASVQDSDGHYCGAALIDDEWALTAAHCMDPSAVDNGFKVRVGMRDLASTEGVSIPAIDVLVFPDFSEQSMDGDIALVRLAEPAPAEVERLPVIDKEFFAANLSTGAAVTASGWGSMGDDVIQSTVLQQATLPLIDRQVCIDAYEPAYGASAITETMMCAGYESGGIDTCQGDSGGPLTFQKDGVDYGVGVTSWGSGCANAGYYGVYTNVAEYHEWIHVAKAEETLLPTPLPEALQLTQLEGAADQLQLFSFELPGTGADLVVELEGMSGDADLVLYDGAFAIPTLIQCTSSQREGTESCATPLAHAGQYLIGVYGFTDFTDANLRVTYNPDVIENNTLTEGISLRKSKSLDLKLEVPHDTTNLRINLTGGIGDADLYVTGVPAAGGTPYDCQSYELNNEEECSLQTVPAGTYHITITSFVDVQDMALAVAYDEPEAPVTAGALCEYEVLMQFHRYQFGRVKISNQTDKPMDDWQVSWTPASGSVIKSVHNGTLASASPVRIEGKRFNRSLAAGASTTVQVVTYSASATPEVPVLSGNYCK